LVKSPIVKRSIVIARHRTSVSLEDAFWNGLKEIAIARQLQLSDLIVEIDQGRQGNLSSAIRTFVFDHFHAKKPRVAADHFGAGAAMPAAAQDGRQSL
jgi:predicted DNA-binding ribbon-helix-helix protein